MLVLSDIHFALEPLRRVVATGETLLILGDLVNLTDYRTGEGAVAEVLGIEFARASASARGAGDYQRMRGLWQEQVGDRADEVRAAIGEVIEAQYAEVAEALNGGHGYVIHGNVDRPRVLERALPPGFEYVHGQTREIDGRRFGFVGGGAATPLQAEGEIPDRSMEELLGALGEVDILCTHVAPALDPLQTDVVTGRAERGSAPLLDFIREHRPRLHLFGDVHQPQASTWRIGPTRCRNVGYFRATERAVPLDPGRLQ
ncbi:MAG TPA: metallophosphoesterase [Acidimicrobiia bacterium]|nr:metallophosphoesterase [Acidimicrobiia bacterium]